MISLFKQKTATRLQHFNWGPTEILQRNKEQSSRSDEDGRGG